MQNLIFTFNTVSPVFFIIFLGYFLKQKGFLNDDFISISSRIVFSVTLPCLVFTQLSDLDFGLALISMQVVFIYAGVMLFYGLIWLTSTFLSSDGRDRAAFIQGSYRSNFAIVGIALVESTLGSQALSQAALILALAMPLYNVLAIVALTVPVKKDKKLSFRKILVEIITNPLILATIFSLPFAFFKIKTPESVATTIDVLSDLTLPLALLGIGGSLNFKSLKIDFKLTMIATLIKIIIMPATLTYLAYALGFRGVTLGVTFMLFATPTAIASFVMADAMGCNSRLAGNIIVLSTIGSTVTISTGIYVLKSLRLI
ncbi:MAG: AEC family transporter [Candidatus Zhuqueibacterota bacterium]